MLSSIKRLTKHSAVYGIGHILSRFIGFLLLPIHTNFLIPKEYGTAALLYSSLAILNVIFSYGMDVAFLRFFILEESREGKQRIFSTAFMMILSTGICFSAAMIFHPALFSKLFFRSPEYITLIRLAGGILLADALCLLPFLVLRSEEKSSLFIFLKFLNIVVNLGLNVLFVVVLERGVEGVFLSNLIASVFTLGLLLPVFFQWLRFRFGRDTLSELILFGLPYIPSGLSVIIMDQIGRFFLDRMIGKEATGLFSASYKLGMFMALVVAAFRFAWHPFFLSTSKEENAQRVFARVLTYFLGVTAFLFLTVTFFLDEIVHLRLFGITLFGEGYESGISIVPVILLAYISYGVYINFIVGIYLKKKTKFLPFVTGAGVLVSILANFLLIPILGIMGAAWATFLAYGSMATVLYIVSRRLYPIPYEIGRIVRIGLVTAILFFLGTSALTNSGLWVRVCLIIFFFPFLWVVRFYDIDEKSTLKRFVWIVLSKMGLNRRSGRGKLK